ncbi:MAG: ABC transporter permease subunit [Mycobacterium leprae]
MSHSFLRLWLNRLLLFFVTGFLLVAAIYIPAGQVLVKETQIPLGPNTYRLERELRWDFAVYEGHLRQYITSLFTGQLYRDIPRLQDRYTFGENERHLPDFTPGSRVYVSQLLKDGWKGSLQLFGSVVVLSAALGVLIGALVALRGRLFRGAVLGVAVLGLCLPDFFVVGLGQIATVWTYQRYNLQLWLILAGPGSFKGWVLPVAGLCFAPAAYGARLTINALDEVMRQDYIRTARAKGVQEGRVVFGHALKNVALRLLAGFPPILNAILTSVIVVERMTNWPGLTKYFLGYGDMTTATVGLCFVAWYLLLDGVAASARVWAGSASGQEVTAA